MLNNYVNYHITNYYMCATNQENFVKIFVAGFSTKSTKKYSHSVKKFICNE